MMFFLIFKVTFLAVFMSSIIPMKYSVRKSVMLIAAFHIVLLAANYVVYLLKGLSFLSGVFPITASLPAFLFYCFLSRSSATKVLFSLLTVTVCGMLTSFLGTLPMMYYGSVPLRLAVEFICASMILLLIRHVYQKPYLRMMDTLESGWGLLCLVPGLLIALIYLLQYYPAPIQNRPENLIPVLLVFALTFVLYMIIYLNFKRISEYYQLKNDRKAIALQAELYQKEYATIRESLESIRIFRHDMRHHLQAINAFLVDGNTVEVGRYIRKLDGSLTESVVSRYCENYGVNAVLSSLISRAAADGVEVDCEADIPADIGIDSIELGLVLANALDNAINACRMLDNPSDRKVKVDCRKHRGQLYLRVSNPYAGEVRFEGDFPVAEGEEHGIGTKSIAAITEKHGGVFSFIAEDGIFKTTTTFQC